MENTFDLLRLLINPLGYRTVFLFLLQDVNFLTAVVKYLTGLGHKKSPLVGEDFCFLNHKGIIDISSSNLS